MYEPVAYRVDYGRGAGIKIAAIFRSKIRVKLKSKTPIISSLFHASVL